MTDSKKTSFPLSVEDVPVPFYKDPSDAAVVSVALELLADDIASITGRRPTVTSENTEVSDTVLLAGTLDGSATLQGLREAGLLEEADAIEGEWERYLLKVVANPMPGVKKALVIAGSDRRGAAYGILEISRRLGVSPWVWWADVPYPYGDELVLEIETEISTPPAVKYRGIFLNDEQFRLKPWASKTLDADIEDIGPRSYEKIFELMLRLRSNYIWPAIATTAFGFHPENYDVADRYAVVIGGHHASSMLRSKHEWWRIHGREDQTFNYLTNPKGVKEFWRERLKEIRELEAIFPVGMRGLGDIPTDVEGGLQELRLLNEAIIAEQRRLLAEEVNPKVENLPQLFPLWKEFEEFYDEGLQIPGDITLLRSNDSYGWLRPLGPESESKRSGGLGMYYHLSYMGRPYEYLQLCSTAPAQTWHQMGAALEFGCDRVWVVNVGDIKPAEYALTHFMDFAWKGRQLDYDSLLLHRQEFFAQALGDKGKAAVDLLAEYDRLNAIRRPEFIAWKRMEPARPVQDSEFSLFHFDEIERRIADWENLEARTMTLENELDENVIAAFYQLVRFPIALAASWNIKHLNAQRQRHYARLGCGPAADEAAKRAEAAFQKMDGELYPTYQMIAEGKWRHFMDIHMVGDNYGPPVLEPITPIEADAVLEVEGHRPARTVTQGLTLPEFHPLLKRSYALHLHACHEKTLEWTAAANRDWIHLDTRGGRLTISQRIVVSIDWANVPANTSSQGSIEVRCGSESWTVSIVADNPDRWKTAAAPSYLEDNGRVSIQASRFMRHTPRHGVRWVPVAGLGHHDTVVTPLPFTAEPRFPDDPHRDLMDSACLEYDVFLAAPGEVTVTVAALPTQPLSKRRGAAYGISFDDQPPALIDLRTHGRTEAWKVNVERGLSRTSSTHRLATGGAHTLKLWMADTNVAVDGILIDCGGGWPSYQQPPETFFGKE